MAALDPHAVAVLLDTARTERRTLAAGAVDVGDLVSAYAVQRELSAIRLGRGDAVVGWKLGYTTAAMREQMGIEAPNYGPLLASMLVRDGTIPAAAIQPRVEPEIALVLARDPGIGASAEQVLDACARAHLALEVVDSVWTAYRFDLEHNTADGSSAAGFVVGDELPLRAGAVEVVLHVDSLHAPGGVSRVEERGASTFTAAAESVAWLADRLAERGEALRPGDVVLTGGLTRAVAVEPGATASARTTGEGAVARVGVRR